MNTHPFHHVTFIPFHLADTAGILFFSHVFTLAHQAYEQFVILHLGYPWDNWFKSSEWIIPIKHAEALYHAPIKAGQECLCNVTLESIGDSSFTLSTELFQKELSCTIKTTHVFCDPHTKKKMAIPLMVLERLKVCTQTIS